MGEISPIRSTPIRAVEYVLPEHINNHGTLFGGKLFEMMDKTAAVAALRFCHTPVVTASIDTIDFHVPIRQGNILELEARVIFTGTSSLVVQVRVFREPRTGGEQILATTGRIVFVAVSPEGKPTSIPSLRVETPEEQALWEDGSRVKAAYEARKKHAPK